MLSVARPRTSLPVLMVWITWLFNWYITVVPSRYEAVSLLCGIVTVLNTQRVSLVDNLFPDQTLIAPCLTRNRDLIRDHQWESVQWITVMINYNALIMPYMQWEKHWLNQDVWNKYQIPHKTIGYRVKWELQVCKCCDIIDGLNQIMLKYICFLYNDNLAVADFLYNDTPPPPPSPTSNSTSSVLVPVLSLCKIDMKELRC